MRKDKAMDRYSLGDMHQAIAAMAWRISQHTHAHSSVCVL